MRRAAALFGFALVLLLALLLLYRVHLHHNRTHPHSDEISVVSVEQSGRADLGVVVGCRSSGSPRIGG